MTTIGLDVGGTKVLGVVVDPLDPSRVLIERRVPTPAGGEGLVDEFIGLGRSTTTSTSGDRAAGNGAKVRAASVAHLWRSAWSNS